MTLTGKMGGRAGRINPARPYPMKPLNGTKAKGALIQGACQEGANKPQDNY